MFSKFKNRKGVAMPTLMLLLQLLWLCPLSAAAEKTVWYEGDTAPDGVTNAQKLTNRRALVGSGCMVNRIGNDGVSVVPLITNLENLCDEDLTNTATMENVIKADVAAGPLISVRDVKNHYAAGTKAGFIVTASESKLLGLDLGNAFSIMFYLEGKLQETVAVESGQTASALGLSLIQVGGSESCKEYVATSTKEFDEIRLSQVGVLNLSVAANLGLKYAFVGTAKEYTLTSNADNGISKYVSDAKRSSMTVTARQLRTTPTWDLPEAKKLIDEDLTNGAASLTADVKVIPTDDKEVFPKGTQVGFDYAGFSVADIAANTTITLYNKKGDKVENHEISLTVLSLLKYDSGKISVTAENDFSEAYLVMTGKLGGTVIHYAFVSLQPDIEKHHCDINASADLNVCNCDNGYELKSSLDGVTWSVKSKPKGSEVAVNEKTGVVTGLDEAGQYVFTAKATDGCTEDVTINYGSSDDIKTTTESMERLVNKKGETALYEATSGSSIDVSLFGSLKNSNALVTPSLRDYAYTTAGADLLGKSHIISLHKKSGTFKYSTKKYVGFVVKAKTTVLNASLLDFLTVDLYKNGEKVSGSLVKSNAVLSADLINTAGNAEQRTSYMVEVPAETEFDEIALNKIGTLTADLSQMNIYYAFVSDNDGNPETSGTIVSYSKTGASIDAANTNFVAVANAANTAFGLTELVDDDLTTGVTLPAVSVANGTTIGVKIGKTINPAKQNLLIVTSNTSAVLSADLVKVLKVELYKGGVKVDDSSTGSGVDVLNANVLGYNSTHSYIDVTSSKEYDEVVLTYGNGATVADAFKIYGILLRNDYNQDGISDDIDPEPCEQELVLDEDVTLTKAKDYNNVRMIFSRTFNGGAWNSIILPVNLTKAQFFEAFGSYAKLSEANNVSKETADNVTTTTLMFKAVEEETDGVFMKKNTPYIIYLSTDEVANHSADEQYESIEDGTVSGPLYFVESNVNFAYSDVTPQTAGTDFTFTGSYDSKQALEVGWYIFNKGNLYHTTKEHTQKAYRCWIEYNPTNNAPLNGFGIDDGITGVTTIMSDMALSNDARLYNLSGQRISPSDSLSSGIYIMNGKKFIVR